jgi:hypothetical protein
LQLARRLLCIAALGVEECKDCLMEESSKIRKIAFVGDHLPRKCGIATFTSDLLAAVAAAHHQSQCFSVSVNDIRGGYEYPQVVRFEIEEQDLSSYLRAADFLNISDVDIVCLQHEFGIFGGLAGGHILALLRELRMPVVTTLHTILREPKADQRLTELQISEKGHFRSIGTNGFYRRGGMRANFDQQPIDAQAMVSACLEAYRATSDLWWYEQAQRAFGLVHRLERSRIGTLLSQKQAAAAMGCTWIGSTGTRERNQPWPSCFRWGRCAWRKIC